MKRWMVWLSAMVLVMGMFLTCNVALAQEPEVTVDTETTFQEFNGEVQVPLWIDNTGGEERELSYARIGTGAPYVTGVSVPAAAIAANSKVWVVATITVDPEKANPGNLPVSPTLELYFQDSAAPVVTPAIKIRKNSVPTADPAKEQTPGGGEQISALVLDPTGIDGTVVPAPSGNAGDVIKVRLPIRCRAYYVTGVQITPQLSANLDEFPFEIKAVDYTRSLPDLAQGAKAELAYEFRLSPKVTSGLKPVTFNAVYYNAKGEVETTSFVIYVTVVKGAAPEGAIDPSVPQFVSTPKLIVEAYSTDPERLIAGEQFQLKLKLKNTSDLEAVENIQVSLNADKDGAIMPGENGSNTLYIKKIDKGESIEQTIPLQSAPDAEARAHLMTIVFGYEGAKSDQSYETTETITLPIEQKLRVKIDEPTIYDEEGVMVDQSVGVYFGLYNMGKSAIYNCMVEVEGEGLRMEESYFGGNVSPGATMRADFNIIPTVAGAIEGTIVITYEDVYGEQIREEKPFSLYVDEGFMYEPSEEMFGEEEMMPQPEPEEGLGAWLYVIIAAAVVVAAVVVLLIVRSRRRKKRLEDL